MKHLFLIVAAFSFVINAFSQNAPSVFKAEDLAARLKVARQLAREMNNRELTGQIEDAGKTLKTIPNSDLDQFDQKVRGFELAVGIDPGGWSMSGLEIARPTPELSAKLGEKGRLLTLAMEAKDVAHVKTIIEDMTLILGKQAGVPDARRKGDSARKVTVSPAEHASIFVRALEGEGKYIRSIRDGKPIPDQMLRLYADLIRGICEVRPVIQKHNPDRLKEVDAVCRGACQILIDAQQPDGLFPFPDLRGKNIRFGEMTENLVRQGSAALKDGWIVSADPSGGSQFDTGECGTALLIAGELYDVPEWSAAGLKAAAWAEKQKCVPNFNYNSFSVGLLAHAYRMTKERKYWDAAWSKWELGVAPGQTASGRWIDAHNARTVYHLIILRGMNDLLAAKPDDLPAKQSAQLHTAAAKAVQAVVQEFQKIGVTNTSHALRELIRYRELTSSGDQELQSAIVSAASVIYARCSMGERAKFGASATELAVLSRAFQTK